MHATDAAKAFCIIKRIGKSLDQLHDIPGMDAADERTLAAMAEAAAELGGNVRRKMQGVRFVHTLDELEEIAREVCGNPAGELVQ